MIDPRIEDLLSRVDSKFTLVSLAAKRAREINAYYNGLGDALGTVVPPQVHSTSRKSLSIAFEEIAVDKIGFERFDPDEEEAAAAAAAADAAAKPDLEVIEGGAGKGDDSA
jgi:DNA-directed RNA polymerase subunit omega